MDRLKVIKDMYDEWEPKLGLDDGDVLWLISRLEIAEKALEDIVETHKQPLMDAERRARGTAMLALQQLRS